MESKHVCVIGAGLGGLSCGIHLLNKGYRVTILEKNGQAGGRASVIEEKGFCIDMAPTILFMPEVLEDIFTVTGHDISQYLTLKRLTPAYQILFDDGRVFHITDNLREFVRQVKQFVPTGEVAFFEYLKDVQDKFVYSKHTFIQRNYESIWDMVNLESAFSFLKVKPFGHAYGHVWRHFRERHLAAALSLQTLFLGQSPFKTPALYNLLAYIEFAYGTWYPMGGINQIPRTLARLFQNMGGVLRCNVEVQSLMVERGQAHGVRLPDGSTELYDVVVSNRDLPSSYHDLVAAKDRPSVPDAKIGKWHYSCSAVMFYLGLKRKVKGYWHHNIVLSRDFLRSLDEIFNQGKLPEDPVLYVCSPTKTDETLAPAGKEIVYILALAPNLRSGVDWGKELPAFRRRVFSRLKRSGLEIAEEDIEFSKVFTPLDFEEKYGTFNGTGFGLAPDFFQSACFRPMTRSKDIRNFYHVGMSTHPGGGMPMVLMCGRLVADQIAQHYPAHH